MLGGTRHDATLYTLKPPTKVPEGVRVAVPSRWRRRTLPPPVRRYTFLHTDYKPLFSMARDSDVVIVSDWDIFMEKTAARRILFYFHSQLAPADISDADPGGPDAGGGAGRSPATAAQGGAVSQMRGLRARIRSRLLAGHFTCLADPRIVLVPNSEFTGRRVERAFGRAAHGAVYPPVDVRGLAGHRGSARKRRAATVGTFAPRKRHDMCMRIARAAGVPLDIVGGTLSEAHARRFRSLEAEAERGGASRSTATPAGIGSSGS